MPHLSLLALVERGLRIGTLLGLVISAALAVTFFALVCAAPRRSR